VRRRGACPEDACGVAHVLVHARYGGETDGGDRWRREHELRHDHRFLREHEFERTERPLVGDGEQDEQADGDAREPHPGVHDGLRELLAGELGEAHCDGDGDTEQRAQRHRDDAHVQRDEDDARDVAVPEREVEDSQQQVGKVFQWHAQSLESSLHPSGTYCWKLGSSETASGKNNCSPFTWYPEMASWAPGLVIQPMYAIARS